MKALIAAGGRGTRLRPITHTHNKHLVPIANKPLILYPLEAIAEAGIKEIGVVVNETQPEIEALLGNGSTWGVKITYINQPYPGGLAHVVQVAKNFLGQDKFVLHLGDNILFDGLRQFVQEFKKAKFDAMALAMDLAHKSKSELSRFGIGEVRGDKLIKYHEHPKNPPTSLAIIGVYFFTPKVWNVFQGPKAIKPSKRGELEISDTYKHIIEDGGDVRVRTVSEWWKDPGNPDDLLDSNRLVLERFHRFAQKGKIDKESQITGNADIGEETTIKNSVIRGPVAIGKRCYIHNAYIGPYTSIYDDSIVENAEVEYSVVLKGCHIFDLGERLDHSLLGDHAVVTQGGNRPRGLRMQISDHSEVYLP